MAEETRNILFVEDEPLLGELLVEVLTDRGFLVTVARDANTALRYLDGGGKADLLFTDIDLGEGMDGATLARLVHSMRPQMPIIYASARCSLGEIQAVPGSVFLRKPYTLKQVDATLAQFSRAAA